MSVAEPQLGAEPKLGTEPQPGAEPNLAGPVAPRRRAARRRPPAAALLGLGILAVMVLAALFAPWLGHGDPATLSRVVLAPPGAGHWLGTDDVGRDVFTRVLFGARVSLVIGLCSAVIAVLVGSLLGAVAGFVGGVVDDALMRVTELFQVIPRFLLAIVVVALFGSGGGKIVLVIGLLSWPATARIVRAQCLVLRREEFVLAAAMSGASVPRTIWRHIMPNVAPYIVVSAALQTGSAILVESFLSFLGLGDPAYPSWGLLLQQAQIYLATAWWMATFPGLALSLAILGLNLAAEAVAPGARARG